MNNNYTEIEEKCSKCGFAFNNLETEYIFHSKNDKNIIKKLLNREFEQYVCPNCGHRNTRVINKLEYIDEEKNFKIFYRKQFGAIMKIYNDLLNEDADNNPMEFFGVDNNSEEYRYYGTTDLDEIVTAICAFENNLDIKVVWLVLHDLAKQLDKEDKGLNIYGLTYDEKHNLVCEFKEINSEEHVFNRFPFNKYEEYREKYSEQLKPKPDYNFGYQAAVNFFKRIDQLKPTEKETTFVITNKDIFALVPSYIDKLKIGDAVVINDNDNVSLQRVSDTMKLKNNTINFDYDETEYPFVQNICYPLNIKDLVSNEDFYSNEELCNQLKKCEKTGLFNDVPYAELLDKTFYVPCCKTKRGEIVPIVSDKAVCVIVSNKIKTQEYFLKIKFKDFKKYLEMYVNTKVIEGIAFFSDYGENDVTFLSMSAIFKAPVKCLMENENHMKMVLNSLEKEYREYLTFYKKEDAYKAIRFMYFNNHENKQFQIAQEELGVNEKTIHAMLNFGYVRLQRIVKSRF